MQKKSRKIIESMAAEAGCELRAVTHGKHLKLRLATASGKEFTIIAGNTPNDCHADRNLRADIKRKVAELSATA